MSKKIDLFASIRPANPVTHEPEATIYNWSIHRATYHDGDVTDHLMGSIVGKNGRVTSAVKWLNPVARTIITISGRVYQLSGSPGFSNEADFIWQTWKNKHDVINDEEVSIEYEKRITNIIN